MKKSIVLAASLLAISTNVLAIEPKLELRRIMCSSESEGYAPMQLLFSDGMFTKYAHLSVEIGDDSHMPILTAEVTVETKDSGYVVSSEDGKFLIRIPTSVRSAPWSKGVDSKMKLEGVGNIENYTLKCSYNTSRSSEE